jgi:DNA-binding MarR family transcriptional regulator
MSRDVTTDSRDFDEQDDSRKPTNRMTLSQGRGGSGSEDQDRKRTSPEDVAAIRERVDRAAQGHPTVTDFQSRLSAEGVRLIPSMQSDGRWNGVTYEMSGVKVKGSALGRSYTAQGLQQRKGVRYEPEKDRELLRQLAGEPRSPQPTTEVRESDPGSRIRQVDGLNNDEKATLWDVGRFRLIASADLAAARYGGRSNLMERDIKHLSSAGLIERRTIPVNSRGKSITVLTLTKKGKAAAQRSTNGALQTLYSGFVKPREVVHDAALYKMFQAETARIERDGGRVRRVVLDYELKKRAYAPLARAHDLEPLAYAERQQEIAQENGLQVVEGRMVFPDVRVEYETADGEARTIDLELATQNYRAAHIAGKAAAGFRVYAQAKGGHLSAVLDRHDLIAEIIA